MSLNVKEEPKCPLRKNHSRLAPSADRSETVSSSKGVSEHGLVSQIENLDKYLSALTPSSGEVHLTTGSQCLPQQSVPLRASDSTAFKMILSEVSLAAPFNNFNILQ